MAELYGVQTRYRDVRGRQCESPRESVLQVLGSLGAWTHDVGRCRDLERALDVAIKARKAEMWRRVVEPVLIAWDGVLPSFTVRLPLAARRAVQTAGGADASGQGLKLTLFMEGEGELQWEVGPTKLRVLEEAVFDRWRFVAVRVRGQSRASGGAGSLGHGTIGRSDRLPLGYHRLRIESGDLAVETTVISSPRRCWTPFASVGTDPGEREWEWGVFAPLYALRSERNLGAGDLADLRRLCEQTGEAGGSIVATLPLLAVYLDHPFEPAPYRPVSRLFWNEFYLAVDRMIEWERCETVRAVGSSVQARESAARLRAEPLVDYRETMRLKRRVLEESSRCFFSDGDGVRKQAFLAYLRTHPDAQRYAAFRAGIEADQGAGMPDVREAARDTTLEAVLAVTPGVASEAPLGVAPEAMRYHLYCQWQMEEQLIALSQPEASLADPRDGSAGRTPAALLLDLPVGVHPGGFDPWRWPALFAPEMSIGAPPDGFFSLGQDWHSPPLRPERAREDGHGYFARCLRHHMRHGRYLRIDHVMSLHRLFWIPEGAEPADGVYVDYPAEELYAVVCLESHHNRTMVVGEDLGTVPPGLRAGMQRHGLSRTWVLQSSLRPRAARPVRPVPRHAAASLGTHDMFPFAGFLRGDDIAARVATGQLGREDARRESAARRRLVARLAESLPAAVRRAEADAGRAAEPVVPSEVELLQPALEYLAASEADLVVVNLDDLLGETRAQNLPGTGAEFGNWRRKTTGSETDVQRAIADAARLVGGRGVLGVLAARGLPVAARLAVVRLRLAPAYHYSQGRNLGAGQELPHLGRLGRGLLPQSAG